MITTKQNRPADRLAGINYMNGYNETHEDIINDGGENTTTETTTDTHTESVEKPSEETPDSNAADSDSSSEKDSE